MRAVEHLIEVIRDELERPFVAAAQEQRGDVTQIVGDRMSLEIFSRGETALPTMMSLHIGLLDTWHPGMVKF